MAADLSNLDETTRNELAQLALTLSANTKTRKDFLKLTKQVNPDTPIPEIDEVEALNKELAKRDEAIAKQAKDFEDYRLQQSLERQRQAVLSEHELSAEDLKKMEEMIGKKELPADYNWAARLYKQQIEPVSPTAYGLGWGKPELPADEGLMADEQNWSIRTAHQMIDEMQRGKKPSF